MPSGILLIDKEIGVTSRKVDNLISKAFKEKKAGHLGTLDPFATGLLILALGKATKCLNFIEDEDKTYVATLKLGQKSDTGDKDGKIIETREIGEIDKKKIEEALSSFLGLSYQLPPMASAIKKDGIPLYELARQGKQIEREKRKIEIFDIRLISYNHPYIEFECKVSKGTYVRTLGEDIASKLGTIGHLVALRRIKIGDIDVGKAKKIDELSELDLLDPISFINIPKLEIQDDKPVLNGMSLKLESSEDRLLLTSQGKALAVYERKEDGHYHCLRGLF